MPTCEHSDICGRDALDGHGGKCILHSEDSEKNEETFEEALEEHREDQKPNFQDIVFPSEADFSDVTFEQRVEFRNAIFEGGANFSDATFEGEVDFDGAYFEDAGFHRATFKQEVYFTGAAFKEATFSRATFEKKAFFSGAFLNGEGAEFDEARFNMCKFRGGAKFTGRGEGNRAFSGGEVSFRKVTVPPDADFHFRYVDLSRCRFLRTDLRNADFISVQWCEGVSEDELFYRVGLFEEIAEEKTEDKSTPWVDEDPSGDEEIRPWPEIERLYRQLKKNYEERGDFPRAGDFHIGEKEARLSNPDTNCGTQLLLVSYRALSKYGERALPALLWLIGIIIGCAFGYLLMGGATDSTCLNSWGCHDLWEALILSGEATLFPVQSAGFHSIGPRVLNLLQRGLSPILIALLALALRQRVKR